MTIPACSASTDPFIDPFNVSLLNEMLYKVWCLAIVPVSSPDVTHLQEAQINELCHFLAGQGFKTGSMLIPEQPTIWLVWRQISGITLCFDLWRPVHFYFFLKIFCGLRDHQKITVSARLRLTLQFHHRLRMWLTLPNMLCLLQPLPRWWEWLERTRPDRVGGWRPFHPKHLCPEDKHTFTWCYDCALLRYSLNLRHLIVHHLTDTC